MVPKDSLISVLKCAECKNVLRNPSKCKHCETLFCELCLHESPYFARGTCPNKKCLKPFESSQINRQLLNALKSLKVTCRSCKSQVPYADYEDHFLTCKWCTFCN